MIPKQILIIHPNDKSTDFLSKIKRFVKVNFSEDVDIFNIHPNDESHNNCLDRILNHPSGGLIIFLGHGRSDKLFGSVGVFHDSSDFASISAREHHPELYYCNDNFINKDNIDVFKNKKVFCLACNSNSSIATYALEKGATTFLGFGDIPTSVAEFAANNTKVTNDVVIHIKTELNYIIKSSLVYSILKRNTFLQLLQMIQIITHQRLANIVVDNKRFKERHILADYLYYLQRDAKIIGEKNAKLIETYH